MTRTEAISNSQDVIDSRDVIARIAELESLRNDAQDSREDEMETMEDGTELYLSDEFGVDEYEELLKLKALEEEASGSPDWQYGEGLIRDTYFQEYAEQLAEDIGAINRDAQWPNNYIDWERAADALKSDYMRVDFDGEDYWIRG